MTTGPVVKPSFERWRFAVVYLVMVAMIVYILWRLISLQVIQGQEWLDRAVENYTANITDPAPRGIIYDRNGYVLARNVASYNVIITPAELPDDEADIQNIYRELSALIDVPTGFPLTDESIEEAKLFGTCVEGPGIAQMVALGASLAPYTPVKIKCNVGDEVARITREHAMDWPGVGVEVEPIREYPTGSLTANVIGFLGPIPANLAEEYSARRFVPGRDKVGYAGVELTLDPLLLGTNGLRVIQEDVAGKELRNLEPPIAPIPGYNVTLTIDTRLQSAAEAAITNEIAEWNRYFGSNRISSGVVIAMNPKTGEVLAMVTFPTYENNRMSRFIPGYYYNQLSLDPRKPLLNNAISSEFPPGSVFKLSTATGALNEGVVTIDKIIETPGQLQLREIFNPNDPGIERQFVDWVYNQNNVINEEGFGTLDFLHCIAFSSNVCFYKLGGGYGDEILQGLGIERLGEYARALGYDRASGIELLGEADGLIPSPQWKRINTGENWSTGDTYIASVGQGYVLATPLQVLMSGATIANKGKLMQPTIVRDITDGDGKPVEAWFNPQDIAVTTFQAPDSYQISPFTPNMKWDVTVTPLIKEYSCGDGYCSLTEDLKIIKPESIEAVRAGTRMAVTEPLFGTLYDVFNEFPIAVAGKTGTAEYCDDVARAAQQCDFGKWPTHSWTLAYAPYDDPEIIVLAFAYHGGEGASVAAPIVERVIRAYFELKAIDISLENPAAGQ